MIYSEPTVDNNGDCTAVGLVEGCSELAPLSTISLTLPIHMEWAQIAIFLRCCEAVSKLVKNVLGGATSRGLGGTFHQMPLVSREVGVFLTMLKT